MPIHCCDPSDGGREGGMSEQDQTELQTVLRDAVAGSESAWRTLVEAYAHRVHGLIRSQCGSEDLAEEITQSTFCTVAAKLGAYDEVGRFESWLFRIAMNRLRDVMRRRRRHATVADHDAIGTLSARRDRPSGSAMAMDDPLRGERADEATRLRLAMEQLSDNDQEILRLRHSAGLSFKQIAEALEVPLGTVLARQHRALKRLSEVMLLPEQDSNITGADDSSPENTDSTPGDGKLTQ